VASLADLLALLPDNTTGDIGANDLRTIVTELWNQARTYGNLYAYRWDTGAVPATGKLTMDQPWQLTATKLLLSETTDDGLALTFALIDNATSGTVWLSTSAGSKLEAAVLGPTVDLGTYREVPVQVTSIAGTQPGNNAQVTVTVAMQGA
jgi:hypothetical protein